MSYKPIRAPLLLALAVLVVSCASPKTRIEKNPEGFAKLPPEQQELIKQGRIDVGFDETAVKLALGEPDRVSERTDAHGKSTVWRYVEYDDYGGYGYGGFGYGGFGYGGYGYGGALFHPGYYHRGFLPFYPAPFYPYYPAYGRGSERDLLRVVFADGKVTSIEQEVK